MLTYQKKMGHLGEGGWHIGIGHTAGNVFEISKGSLCLFLCVSVQSFEALETRHCERG